MNAAFWERMEEKMHGWIGESMASMVNLKFGPLFCRRLVLVPWAFFATIALAHEFKGEPPSRIRVACIGDSITWGTAMTNRVEECYPAQLQRMLGDGYDVRNFGDPGSGVYLEPKVPTNEWCPHPWRKGEAAGAAYAFCPDIVVCNLGVNDSCVYMGEIGSLERPPVEKGLFRRQYIDLLMDFGKGKRCPKFIIWTRLGPTGKSHRLKGKPNAVLMEPDLKSVAAAVNATTLDMLSPLLPFVETPHFAADGIHPEGGAQHVIAEVTACAIRRLSN